MKNYGVENPFQSEEVKDKSKATFLENYGIEYSLQSQEVITSLKIYSFLKKTNWLYQEILILKIYNIDKDIFWYKYLFRILLYYL